MEPHDPMECARCHAVHRPNQCQAHNRAGKQCGKAPEQGQRVCRLHGGAAPQSVAKARARLLAAADPAAAKLVALVSSKDEHTALRAATAVLDRVGLTRDLSNGPGAVDLPVTVQAELVVEFIEGVLTDLAIPMDARVRDVVANRLRAMSAAQARATGNRLVLDQQPGELVAG